MSPPYVSVIVLNWNGLAHTLDCLESLSHLDYPTHKIVVVDNGSVDGSVSIIRHRFATATILKNSENLGFTGGNNVGLRHALEHGADYALLLNNDTEVATSLLRRLVEAAEQDSAVGIAGPTILYHDRPDVVWSSGGAIDWRRGSTRMMGLDERDAGGYGKEPRAVDFVTGCCMLVGRAVLEQVGLLDERFFAYYEEAEWCVRARRAGFKIVHVPVARVWHKISPSEQADSPLVRYYMTRNRLLFLACARAGLGAWVNTLVVEYLRTLLSWSLRPKWQAKKLQRNMMLRAIGDAGRGRWGRWPGRTGAEVR